MTRPILALLIVTAAAPVAAQEAPPRHRVAVMHFDYGPVNHDAAEVLGPETDIGTGIAAILVTDLVQSGAYVVVERDQLDRILAEQNFQQTGRGVSKRSGTPRWTTWFPSSQRPICSFKCSCRKCAEVGPGYEGG